MNSLEPMLRKVVNEWERLVMALVIMTCLIAGGVLALHMIGLMEERGPGQRGGGEPRPLFSDGAFAFIGRDGYQPDLNAQHAFALPHGVNVKRPPVPDPPPSTLVRVETPPDTTRPKTTDPEDDGSGLTVVRIPDPLVRTPDQTRTERPTRTTQDPPPPEPKDFITYKGYMNVDGSSQLAYIQHTHDPGRGRPRQSSSFIGPGQDLLGLKIVEFAEDFLMVEDADGKSHKLSKGARMRVKDGGSL